MMPIYNLQSVTTHVAKGFIRLCSRAPSLHCMERAWMDEVAIREAGVNDAAEVVVFVQNSKGKVIIMTSVHHKTSISEEVSSRCCA